MLRQIKGHTTRTKSSRPFAAIEWTLDIILEYTGHSIVSKALAEFHCSHKPGREWQFLSNVPQRALLMLGRLVTLWGFELLQVAFNVGQFEFQLRFTRIDRLCNAWSIEYSLN